MRNVFVHGRNLAEKERHRTKYRGAEARQYLAEIRQRYDQWHHYNVALVGPTAEKSLGSDMLVVEQRTQLFEEYKSFLDQQKYAEAFDSRSNLHSSVLEEFMYYLFKDLVESFGRNALIGKSHTSKDIFFTPSSYENMLTRPHGKVEIKDHDFVIGATISATFRSSEPKDDEQNTENTTQQRLISTEEPSDYSEIGVTPTTETHSFDLPVIVIECKTYLDKNMLEGSSRAAEELKARIPNALYLVAMERIKLGDTVNLRKYKVDQLYVLRKQKNTDREFTFSASYQRNPIDPVVVWHLYELVRDYLTSDWVQGIDHGIRRGWLL